MKILSGILLMAALGSAGVVFYPSTPVQPPGEDPRFTVRRYDKLETEWNDYIWPTDASIVKTSSFCEFRKTHFHAGIDVSTNMQRGYNVFASRAGWIHSIEFEPGGYGWFLVLRHYDGYYTCYAHLDGFPEAVEQAYIRKLGDMNKSFGYAEWGADEFKVGKGDVVAFTGATGAGPPHLHFEVRDRNFNPVNPELAPALRVADHIPPAFTQIAFVPLDAGSSVNGKSIPFITTVKRLNDTLYDLRTIPVLSGRIGLQINARDKAEGFQDTETPYMLALKLNGAPYFDAVFDRIQDDHEWYIRIDRNNDLMSHAKGEFRKLYKEPGNTLAIYRPDEPWAGVLYAQEAPSGRNTFTITAQDVSGNRALLQGAFTMKPDISISVRAVTPHRVKISGISRASGLRIICVDASGKGAPLQEWKLDPPQTDMEWDIPDAHQVYEVRAVDSTGAVLQQVYCTRKRSENANLTGSYTLEGNTILIDFRATESFNLPPIITVRGGEGVVDAAIEAVHPNRYRAKIVIPPGISPPFRIEAKALIGGTVRTWECPVQESHIDAEQGGTLISSDGKCRIAFPPGTVVQSGFYTLATRSVGEKSVYSVVPGDIPLAGKVQVQIQPPFAHDGKNYIRASSPLVYMRYGTQPFEAGTSWITGVFGRYAAEYQVMRDTISPRISVSRMRNRQIVIRVTDEGSGVNYQSLLVRSGKKYIPLFYDERAGGMVIPEAFRKKNALRNAIISVSDKVGNFTAKEATI